MNRKPLLTAMFAAFLMASASIASTFADDEKPAPAASKPTGDLGKFQGKWSGKFGPDEGLDVVVAIAGNDMEFKILTPDGQEFVLKGEIKVDEKAKPAKTVDWVKFKTPNGDELPDNVGLYKFEDDNTVKVCHGGPGNARPSEFKAEDGGPQIITLKRIVDKEKDAEKGAPKPKAAEPAKDDDAGKAAPKPKAADPEKPK